MYMTNTMIPLAKLAAMDDEPLSPEEEMLEGMEMDRAVLDPSTESRIRIRMVADDMGNIAPETIGEAKDFYKAMQDLRIGHTFDAAGNNVVASDELVVEVEVKGAHDAHAYRYDVGDILAETAGTRVAYGVQLRAAYEITEPSDIRMTGFRFRWER
jgi:hypothetical protein